MLKCSRVIRSSIRLKIYLTKKATDTIVNGTAYWVTGRMADRAVPNANKHVKKTKIRTILRTVWGQQMKWQTFTQGFYNYYYITGRRMLETTR